MLTEDRPVCLYSFYAVDRPVCLTIRFTKGIQHMNTQVALFSPVDLETAPEKSRPLLENVQKSFKFIPNIFGVFANSPTLLEGYLGLEKTFDKAA